MIGDKVFAGGNRVIADSDPTAHAELLAIRAALLDLCARNGFRFIAPPMELCTDNGAMIAFAGALRLAAGDRGPQAPAVRIRPRWPLVELQPPQAD